MKNKFLLHPITPSMW